ncbi:hypothetical protein HYQ46_011811 [Verticillium longisporum]|nr:hypothetical protein HYQ46_011811 [Verticillium longisporum]
MDGSTIHSYLDHQEPDPLENAFIDILLSALYCLLVQRSRLARELGQQGNLLLVRHLLLEEHLLRLRQVDTDQREHASRGLKVVVRRLEAGFVGSRLLSQRRESIATSACG